jgi:hypothetical protein
MELIAWPTLYSATHTSLIVIVPLCEFVPTILWDQEHDQHVSRQLLALIEPDFSPTTVVRRCVSVSPAGSGNYRHND